MKSTLCVASLGARAFFIPKMKKAVKVDAELGTQIS